MDDAMQWVERLGGWAVVLLVVRWMMMRVDHLINGLLQAVDLMKTFENEERQTHTDIVKSQQQILVALKDLHEAIKRNHTK